MTGAPGRSRLDPSLFNFQEINQVAHGFTLPAEGYLPLVYNNVTAEYSLAQADNQTTAADVVAIEIIDADNFIAIDMGYIVVESHGLTVGKWYVLDKDNAGETIPLDTLTGSNENVQYIAYPVDVDTILIRIQPMFVEDFFVAQDIAILEDWAAADPTLTAGTDRLLIVTVNWEDDTANSITDIQVGGVSGTPLVDQIITSGFSYGIFSFYWTDAEIETMVGSAVSVTYASGAPLGEEQSSVLLQFVDQSNPVVAINTDSGTGATDTLDSDVNALAGGYVFLSAGGGNAGMGFTNNGTGFTRKLDLVIPSADGVVDDKLIAADATPENVNMGITGSNRHVMVAASLRRREA